jgi:hypothetical protein
MVCGVCLASPVILAPLVAALLAAFKVIKLNAKTILIIVAAVILLQKLR